MKNLFVLCLLLLLILSACGKNDESKLSIAILTPVTHPSLEQIEKGFMQTMESNNPGQYRFVTYNAQGNKTLMRSEIEEIARQNYDLVFTIGTSSSQMASEVFAKKEITTPIVFTCVNDPVGFQIVSSEQAPGRSITGVKEMLHFQEELSALLKFKPTIKKILLVYNPAEPGLQKDKEEIEQILKQNQIELMVVETFQTNEMMAKTSPFINQVDALIVIKDNTVVSGLDILIKLCNQYKIPLMASDLDSPDRGAAFGYGVYERDFGIEAAKKAQRIIQEGIDPAQIPVTPVSNFVLRINRDAALKQGVNPALLPVSETESKS